VLGPRYTGPVTVILFTTVVPSALAADLSRAGVNVYEALAISEVLALATEHVFSQIVITSDVESERAKVIQEHCSTFQLKPGATAAIVIWELAQLSPASLPLR